MGNQYPNLPTKETWKKRQRSPEQAEEENKRAEEINGINRREQRKSMAVKVSALKQSTTLTDQAGDMREDLPAESKCEPEGVMTREAHWNTHSESEQCKRDVNKLGNSDKMDKFLGRNTILSNRKWLSSPIINKISELEPARWLSSKGACC